ncbi:MAG: sodium:solute symporter family protein [candidate division NC10 bacterium]|nr:sodium:solute symporter family protein [candidate division NC10 bacterium]
MSPAAQALSMIFLYLAVVLVVGVAARLKGTFSISEYLVGGRAFGLFLLYFLMVGDIYSGFAFLGAGGWAFRFGVPIFYSLAYSAIAYIVFYFLGPKIWRVGRDQGYITQPDFFEGRYESPILGLFVTLFGFLYMIPYLQLQIMAGGLIFNAASFGLMPKEWGILLAFLIAGLYVYTSGLRGVAWTNVVQAIVMLGMAIAAIVYVIPSLFGSLGQMFRQLAETSPRHLTLPGAKGDLGYAWYTSTTLMSGLGFWMWPHLFQNTYSARDDRRIRITAVFAPFYTFLVAITATLGFAAILIVPDLKEADLAVLEVVKRATPPWFLGLVGAGGLAAAMSTADTLTLCPAGLLGRNIYQRWINPGAPEMHVARIIQRLTILVLGISVFFAFYAPSLLVYLLLVGYSGITQFFPGAILGLYWRRATKVGILSGLIVGEVLAALFLFVPGWKHPLGIFAGFWGLVFNFLMALVVSLRTTPPEVKTLRKFGLA